MDDKEKQVLNVKLAKWAGFKLKPNAVSFGTIDWSDYVWHDPEGNPRPDFGLPDFTGSLDDCYKWLVPILEGLDGHGSKIQLVLISGWGNTVFVAGSGEAHSEYGAEVVEMGKRVSLEFSRDPALAVCLAIEKVVDKAQQKL